LQPGGADCRLEARIAAWRVSRVALWNPRVPFNLELHRWPFAAPGGHLELQDVI